MVKRKRPPIKVLVVDDDQHIIRLYKEELEDEGYTVFSACNGHEAMDYFDKINPDIVTLDILLPDIDGICILRKMKEKNPKIPVIMSTAFDFRDDFAVWASEAFIVKSSELDELKTMIKVLTKETYSFTKQTAPVFTKIRIEAIIELANKIRSGKVSPTIYGEKLKTQINLLLMSIDKVTLYIEHEATSTQDKMILRSLKSCKQAANYCEILARTFEYILRGSKLSLSKTNVNGIIDEVMDILSDEIQYNFSKQYCDSTYIRSDQILLRNILFVLLKNINYFLVGKSGALEILTVANHEIDSEIREFEVSLRFYIKKAHSNTKRIMIVDDDDAIRKLYKYTLEDAGYNVTLADDGFACLDNLRKEPFDLIILDMQMVGMEGFEVLQTLRRDRTNMHIPVIIFSAYSEVEGDLFRKKVAIYNPVQTLHKTADEEKIIKLVNTMINTAFIPFKFQALANLDLATSISHDPLLRVGFSTLMSALKSIQTTIEFDDDSYDTKHIRLRIPSLPAFEDNNRVINMGEQSTTEIYVAHLNEMHACFRHDLRNKLQNINYTLGNLKLKQDIASSCLKLLDDMRDISEGIGGLHE